ncbi:sigma-70 family RNA polymerase sigma factor [Lysinibacillus sp. NPDC056959]|uniref:sigma-70 family RNA polymerase sigma factor n=1 Tax=Lysinibacillus sp. NPDC056959 TaxID=3345981 RepID=UPI0036294C89
MRRWSNSVKKLPSKPTYIALPLTSVIVIFQSWRYKKIQVIDYWSKLKSLSDNPEEEILMGETDALLVASIEKLPTKYKDVLLLFHFAEFSLKDVAELLKLPVNTVKTRLRRARQMVGFTLLEEGFEYGSDS